MNVISLLTEISKVTLTWHGNKIAMSVGCLIDNLQWIATEPNFISSLYHWPEADVNHFRTGEVFKIEIDQLLLSVEALDRKIIYM